MKKSQQLVKEWELGLLKIGVKGGLLNIPFLLCLAGVDYYLGLIESHFFPLSAFVTFLLIFFSYTSPKCNELSDKFKVDYMAALKEENKIE